MRRTLGLVLAIAVMIGAVGREARAQVDSPPDEATREPALVEARRRLIDALERRDEIALRPLLHPEVVVGNGGDQGPQDVIDLLRERPAFADQYIAILRMGGHFGKPDLFMAPFAAKPSYGADDDRYVFASRPDVVLRTEPREDASVARALGHAIVEAQFDENVMKLGWVKIVGPAGYAGYVSVNDVFTVGEIFIHFRKTGDRWLVVRMY